MNIDIIRQQQGLRVFSTNLLVSWAPQATGGEQLQGRNDTKTKKLQQTKSDFFALLTNEKVMCQVKMNRNWQRKSCIKVSRTHLSWTTIYRLYLLKVKLETICYRKCTDCHLVKVFCNFFKPWHDYINSWTTCNRLYRTKTKQATKSPENPLISIQNHYRRLLIKFWVKHCVISQHGAVFQNAVLAAPIASSQLLTTRNSEYLLPWISNGECYSLFGQYL